MQETLCFLIIFVFTIITMVVFYIIGYKKENFYPTKPIRPEYTKSKFYLNQPTKWEKVNSLYSPIICRPPEHSGLTYSGKCTGILYPKTPSPHGKGEMTAPCNPHIEAKYYAMRPLITSENYHKMLEILFKSITQEYEDKEEKWFQNEFCNSECYSDVMKFIMKQINTAKNELGIFKEYAKNDTWGGEQFAFLNENVFSFTTKDYQTLSEQDRAKAARYNKMLGPKKYIVTFTLHNTLRSSSTDIVAIVFQKEKKMILSYINFATKKETNPFESAQVTNKSGNIITGLSPPQQNTPSWIYGNNIENVTFNLKGFHDPDENKNILIPGGVPSEFKEVLQKCDQASLMKTSGNQGTMYKGGTGPNATNMASPVYPNFPNKESQKWNIFV